MEPGTMAGGLVLRKDKVPYLKWWVPPDLGEPPF